MVSPAGEVRVLLKFGDLDADGALSHRDADDDGELSVFDLARISLNVAFE